MVSESTAAGIAGHQWHMLSSCSLLKLSLMVEHAVNLLQHRAAQNRNYQYQ